MDNGQGKRINEINTSVCSANTSVAITVCGLVQGVGFRPFIYRLATAAGLAGTVRNAAGAVRIELVCDFLQAQNFIETIKKNAPANSVINDITVEEIFLCADGFNVVESEAGNESDKKNIVCLPDTAICSKCESELFENSSRRRLHFFNDCTECGPRFSIACKFPYDRANTSMGAFEMCAECAAEYCMPSDRRFRAETVCCPKCGPSLFYSSGGMLYKGAEAFDKAIYDLPGGIAVKGTGGYHLACSPYDQNAVMHLRKLKGRDAKPFAVMFRDIAEVEKICKISAEERKLLCSREKPIVLLEPKVNPFAEAVAGNADGRLGCFLPYTALHALIAERFPAIVLTSANRESSPIVDCDEKIFSVTDRVLYNDRKIVRAVEDSVVTEKFILRRSRGYAPMPLAIKNPLGAKLFAAGGDLKASFGFLQSGRFTMSPHLGDLENADVLEKYGRYIDDMCSLFVFVPEEIVCDAHPKYFSSMHAKKIAGKLSLPFLPVYHHHAHIASVMAEHGLRRVLGAAFDGGGYGADGCHWGGEFLLCDHESGSCRRLGHLRYTDLLGADEAVKNTDLSAACFLHSYDITLSHPEKKIIEAALNTRVNTFASSSVGRLFDAVSSLLGICGRNGYEGEAATLLQYAAEAEARSGVKPVKMKMNCNFENEMHVISCKDILEKCSEKKPGCALGFHHAVCDAAADVFLKLRGETKINDVALSGGVFQNRLLLSLIENRLQKEKFSVFLNKNVPPNDGGLALGQAYAAAGAEKIGGEKNVRCSADGSS